MGTSPQMRGAAHLCSCRAGDDWNIPADAGSRSPKGASTTRAREHPRRCREQGMRQFRAAPGNIPVGAGGQTGTPSLPSVRYGTSPRKRGTGAGAADDVDAVGNIPANAGSSGRYRSTGCSCREHPAGAGSSCCGPRGTFARWEHPTDTGSSEPARDCPHRSGEQQGDELDLHEVGPLPDPRGCSHPAAHPVGRSACSRTRGGVRTDNLWWR